MTLAILVGVLTAGVLALCATAIGAVVLLGRRHPDHDQLTQHYGGSP